MRGGRFTYREGWRLGNLSSLVEYNTQGERMMEGERERERHEERMMERKEMVGEGKRGRQVFFFLWN